MQAVPARQHGVDERLAEVETSSTGGQHPLDELAHLRRREHHRGQLVTPGAGHEDALGLVDPELLYLGIVEEALERPKADQVGHELADDVVGLLERPDGSRETALLVLGDRLRGRAAHGVDVRAWIDAPFAHQGPHTVPQDIHASPRKPSRLRRILPGSP